MRCTHALNLNWLLWILSSLSAARGRHPCVLLEKVNSCNTGLRSNTHTRLGESSPMKDKNNVNQTCAPHGPAPNMKNMQPTRTRPARNALGDSASTLVETTAWGEWTDGTRWGLSTHVMPVIGTLTRIRPQMALGTWQLLLQLLI